MSEGKCAAAIIESALEEVLAERMRQNAKWGEQNHDPITWLAILTEEVGEFSEAALHLRFGGPKAAGLRAEAVQVAAVALQIVECIDRGKMPFRRTVLESALLISLKRLVAAESASKWKFDAEEINEIEAAIEQADTVIARAELAP